MFKIHCRVLSAPTPSSGDNGSVIHDWFLVWKNADGADAARYLRELVGLGEPTSTSPNVRREYRMTYGE